MPSEWCACILFLVVCPFFSCGNENIYGHVYSEEDRFAFDPALDSASALYDSGDYIQAAAYARAAYLQNPKSERAVDILAHSLIGQVGLDPIALTQGLMGKKQDADSEASSSANTADPSLSFLQEAIGIEESMLLEMGTLDSSDPDYPLLLPNCAEEIRDGVEKAMLIDEAIFVLCPFVDSSTRSSLDYRHTCDSLELEGRSRQAKLHFVWGLSHLAESVLFQALMQYSPGASEGQTDSNLANRAKRLEAMETQTPAQVEAAILYMEQLNEALAAIFPARSRCEQSTMAGSYVDLTSAAAAFGAISGLPKKILQPVEKAVAKLDAYSQSAESAGDAAQKSSSVRAAAKEKLKSSLSAKVAQMKEEGVASGEQMEQLCSLYSSISGETLPLPASSGEDEDCS
jgi:hypothetical protein